MTKNVLLSKTVWINALTLGLSVAGYLPEKYAIPTITVGNIVLRLVTHQGVNIIPTK